MFDGLDTFAQVRLNGTTILESENMFLSHRVNVSAVLKPFEDNILSIEFDSALLRGRALEKEHSDHKFIGFNGEMGRLGVRKAQYHWVSLRDFQNSAPTSSNFLGVGLGPSTHDGWTVETRQTGNIPYTRRQCAHRLRYLQ